MTQAVIYTPFDHLAEDYAKAAVKADMQWIRVENAQEMTSLLYRQPESVGVLWVSGKHHGSLIVREMRIAEVTSPIIALLDEPHPFVARVAATARAELLASGCDDAQPYDIDARELAARLTAVAGRGTYFDHLHIELGDCLFHGETGRIDSPRGDFHLTEKEAGILVELARNTGSVRSKQQVMDALYGDSDTAPEMKIIDVLVCKMRAKIMAATGGTDFIMTEWGRGYSFVPEGFVPEMNRVRLPYARQEAAE